MKKIIFLLSTLSTGGGERVASELSLGLPDDIQRIIVLFKKEVSYPYRGEIVSLDILGASNIFKKAFTLFFGLMKFKKIVKKEKPDYVISFGHLPNIINIFSGAKSVVRIDNFYSSSCQGFGGMIYKCVVRFFFNRANIIMPVSKESARDMVEKFKIKKEKIKVAYNPLNIEEIEKLAKEPLEKEYLNIFKNPVVINMGQLGKQKNQKDLIISFGQIKQKIKDAKLVILGKGALEEGLKSFAGELGIKNDIYFLGWQKNPFKFLASSKVFILSSLWEGLPYVLLEAMACGVPVVSYDCRSGPREILAPKTNPAKETSGIEHVKFGVLVKPKNPILLAEAAVKVILDKSYWKELRDKSRTRILDFDSKNIIKEWDFLYE